MSRQPKFHFNRKFPGRSIYADLRVPGDHRAKYTPRLERHYRHKIMAWRGILAFYSDNRFYEKDRFYKAYIPKPQNLPDCKVIRPELYTKTIQEILEEMRLKESGDQNFIDIGLPYIPRKIDETEKAEILKKNKIELEQTARLRTLKLDPKDVERENNEFLGPNVLRKWATHLRIFQDLFHPEVYFHPVVPLTVEYEMNLLDETGVEVTPVCWGNYVTPTEASEAPFITYPSDANSKWTVLAVNPDGNLFEEGNDVVHWMVTNVCGNDIASGSVVYPYLQPLPIKGTGYHRLTYVLFKHHNGQDLVIEPNSDLSLKGRSSFSTPQFYKKYEDIITPAGELHPIYKFSEPAKNITPQEDIPTEAVDTIPFNEYLEKYRPQKEIEEQVLRKRFEKLSPFGGPPTKPKFPGLDEYEDRIGMSSWVKHEKQNLNMGAGKWAKVYDNIIET